VTRIAVGAQIAVSGAVKVGESLPAATLIAVSKTDLEAHGQSGAGETVWAVVVAAGSGNRFGGAKQFSPLGDRSVLDWVVQATARWCSGVVVVVPAAHTEGAEAWHPLRCSDTSEISDTSSEVVVVAGGASRSDSVRCGLRQVPDDAEIILVHDGARPLASDGVFERAIDAVSNGADAAVPVIDVTDSLRWREGTAIDRNQLVAVQTPQAFSADVLRAAHAGGSDATDDATLAEAAGATVVSVAGDPRNLKITEAHDLATAEALLAEAQLEAATKGVGND